MDKNCNGNKRQIFFESPSLNFKSTSIEISVYERNSKLPPCVNWFVGGQSFYSTAAYKYYEKIKHSVNRTTIYEFSDENLTAKKLRLCSPEHLASVFLMWPSRRFDVNLLNIEKPEVPIMDGSALPFFSKIRHETGVPEELSFYEVPIHMKWNLVRFEECFGYVSIEPSETFEVEYRISSIDSYSSVSIYSPEDLYSLFMARTFIEKEDYIKARALGLLKGVDESCGLLLCGGTSASKKFRISSEPAKHKILDLIGDLAFITPSLPKVRIEILNGGHIAHHQILEKLLPYVSLNITP